MCHPKSLQQSNGVVGVDLGISIQAQELLLEHRFVEARRRVAYTYTSLTQREHLARNEPQIPYCIPSRTREVRISEDLTCVVITLEAPS